jgi:bifunctional DNA-binding transcriptional regulator/antitoxin component of YhaV-PrlF toxin-antitoxin module
MILRVQLVEGEFRIVLPMEVVRKLELREGSVVEIESVEQTYRAQQRYITREEAMESYRRTLPQHEAAYRELARGPGADTRDGFTEL